MGKSKRVGIYVRVSTDGQTTENQLRDLQAVAAQREWEVIEVYTDHGVGGSKARSERPAFNRMATDAAKGRINYIAAWALDRLGRSSRDVINFITDLPEQGVGLYLHREQLDTGTAVGKLVLTIMAAVAEMELAGIKERIHAGLRRAKAQGKTLGRKRVSVRIEKKIRELRDADPKNPMGIVRIATAVGCGVSVVQRVLGEATPS